MAINLNAIDKRELNWRQAWSETALALAEADERFNYMLADLGRVYEWDEFKEKYPGRAYNAGIAEQNAVAVCAGMAAMGKIPFFATFSPFASYRVLEQLRDDCAYAALPVRIVGSDTGLSLAALGSTHYGLDDMAAVLAVPGVIVISPSDPVSLAKLCEKLMDEKQPAYIRIGGMPMAEQLYSADEKFEIGKAHVLREGGDAAVLAHGSMTAVALKAAQLLEEKGVQVKVVDMLTVRPIDRGAVAQAARETGLVFTLEEHTVSGGLGSLAGVVMAEEGTGRLIRMGLPDAYISEVSAYEVMMKDLGLDAGSVADRMLKEIKG